MKKNINMIAVALIVALLCMLTLGAQAERMAVSNGVRLNVVTRPAGTEESAAVESEKKEKAAETAKSEEKDEKAADAEPAAENIEEDGEERSAMVIRPDDERQITLYADADTKSAVLGSIPAGAMLGARSISGDWSLVSYEGMIGYVHTADIALFNEEAREDEHIRSVRITNSLEGATSVAEGTIVTLTAKMSGFENDSYTLQWYEAKEGGEFEIMTGETGASISFPITRNNVRNLWRVTVDLVDAEDTK